ncbi:MAG: hypothetical protein Q4F28_15495 [Eubacteriales bacterium]|nr:hypothetical protein [Eubacteriales bacterium]
MYGIKLKEGLSDKELLEAIANDCQMFFDKKLEERNFEFSFGFAYGSKECKDMQKWMADMNGIGNQARPISYTSILDGELMKQGYSFCDIQMSTFLNEINGKREFKDPDGNAYEFASGSLEPSPEQLALWDEIASKKKALGEDFARHYRDPKRMCRHVAEAWKGWMCYTFGTELAKHSGKDITTDSYNASLANSVDAFQAMLVASGGMSEFQQFIQATELMGKVEKESMLRKYPVADYAHGGASPMHEELLAQFTNEELGNCVYFNAHWTEPVHEMVRDLKIMNISNVVSELTNTDGSVNRENPIFAKAMLGLEDIAENINIPVSVAGMVHAFDNEGQCFIKDDKVEERLAAEAHAEAMLERTVESGSMSPEARRSIRCIYMGRTEHADNYLDKKLAEEKKLVDDRKTLQKSVWDMSKKECEDESFLERTLTRRYSDLETCRKKIEQMTVDDSLENANSQGNVNDDPETKFSSAVKERLLNNIEQSRKALDSTWQRRRAMVSRAVGRIKMEQFVERMEAEIRDNPSRQPGQILEKVTMSPALQAELVRFDSQQDKVVEVLNRKMAEESRQDRATAWFRQDSRDFIEIAMLGIESGDTDDQVTKKAERLYQRYYKEDWDGRRQVLDDMYDQFDSFEMGEMDLSCLMQAADESSNNRQELTSSEKDFMKLFRMIRIEQAVLTKKDENPKYFNHRYPTPEDQVIFHLKQNVLGEFSSYVATNLLFANGFNTSLQRIPPIDPLAGSGSRETISLQKYEMNVAMALGKPIPDGLRFKLPFFGGALGGYAMADGTAVTPNCESALKETFDRTAGLLLENRIQTENRELMGLDKYDMLLVDGVPIREKYQQQIEQVPEQNQGKRILALAGAAMLSGKHRVEMIMSQKTINGSMNFRVVPLMGDIHAYSQKEWENRGVFSHIFGEKPREKLLEELWQNDEHREERQNAALAKLNGKIRKAALDRDLAEWKQQGDMPDIFDSPEMEEYRQKRESWRGTLEDKQKVISRLGMEVEINQREHGRAEEKINELNALITAAETMTKDDIHRKLEEECSKKYPDSLKLSFYSRLYVQDTNTAKQECLRELAGFTELSAVKTAAIEMKQEYIRFLQEPYLRMTEQALTEEAKGRLMRRNSGMRPQLMDEEFSAPAKSEEVMKETVRLDIELRTLRPTFEKLREARAMDLFLREENNPPFSIRMELRECQTRMEKYQNSDALNERDKEELRKTMEIVERIVNEPSDAEIVFTDKRPELPQSLSELRGAMRAMAELAVLKEYDKSRTQDMPDATKVWETYTQDVRKREFMIETYVTMEQEKLLENPQNKVDARVNKAKQKPVKMNFSELEETEQSVNGNNKSCRPAERSRNASEAAKPERQSEAQRSH